MKLPFGRTRTLEASVEKFLDLVDRGLLSMKEGIRCYLAEDSEGFERHVEAVAKLEHEADTVQSRIQRDLVTYALLPDLSGDVLKVLDQNDNLLDLAKAVMRKMDIEIPSIPEEYHEDFEKLLDLAVQAADHTVRATRCYMRTPYQVQDELTKIDFYEGECDELAYRLKKSIFRSSLGHARRQHLRDFVDAIDTLSDIADDARALLAVAAIRRVE
jgi:predicted phosphate transport protein (TIGR00153 family)